MESGDDGDGIYNGDGANDGRGRPNVDIDIEVVKDFLMDILKGVPAFRAIIATEATTPPPAREPPATVVRRICEVKCRNCSRLGYKCQTWYS